MNPLLQMLQGGQYEDPVTAARRQAGLPPLPSQGYGEMPTGLAPLPQPGQAPVSPTSTVDPAAPADWKMFAGPPPSSGQAQSQGMPPASQGPQLQQPGATAPAAGPGQVPSFARPPGAADAGGAAPQPGAMPEFLQKPLQNGTYPPPTQAPAAAPDPFKPGFVDTSGAGGIYRPTYANSPEERLAAMAEQVANKTRAGLIGTGFDANYQPVGMHDQLAAAALGQQAAGEFMKAGMGMQKEGFEGRQNEADRQLKALLGDSAANAQRDVAGITGKAHTDAAALHNSPAALRGQGLAQLALKAATDPTVNPAAIKQAMEFFNHSMPDHPAPAAGQAGPSTQKGDGSVPAAGAAPPPGGSLDALFSGNQALAAVRPAFMENDKPVAAPSITHADTFLDRLVGTNPKPADIAAIAEDIRGGLLGDPEAVKKALAQSTARAHFQLQPPQDAQGKPLTINSPMSAFPGLHAFNNDKGEMDLGLRADPRSVGANVKNLYAGGANVPYNKVVLPGGVSYDLDPSDLAQFWTRPQSMAKPDQLRNRAAHGNAILAEILRRNQPPK